MGGLSHLVDHDGCAFCRAFEVSVELVLCQAGQLAHAAPKRSWRTMNQIGHDEFAEDRRDWARGID
jgi:hypothetical protein